MRIIFAEPAAPCRGRFLQFEQTIINGLHSYWPEGPPGWPCISTVTGGIFNFSLAILETIPDGVSIPFTKIHAYV
jgi:hypothetical protein